MRVRRSPGPHRAQAALAVSLLAAALLAAGLAAPAAGQAGPGYGAGIFAVSGSSSGNFSLADGGTYYLCVATDDSSTYVDARVNYSGSLAAELNESGSASTLVSLAAGNYSIALSGHGRAALGWDFTDGSVQDFPNSATVRAFLRPATAHLDLVVSMGTAQQIHLAVYDDRLLPVRETNITTSGTVSVDLPVSRATSAFFVASVTAGNAQGMFGLAWSSPSPTSAGSDLGSQVLVAFLWIAVPVVLALAAFTVLRRRRAGGP